MAGLAGDADRAAVCCYYSFCNRQTHAGAADKVTLVLAAIKLVEDHALFEIVDSRPAIGHAGRDRISSHFRGNGDRLVFCRINIGVVNQVYKRILDAAQIRQDGWNILIDLCLTCGIISPEGD